MNLSTSVKAALCSLLLLGCSTKIDAPGRASSNAIAPTVEAARGDVNDRAAGNNAAIQYVSNTLPASKQKDVIKVFTDENVRLFGSPKQATQLEFEQAADALLKGKTGAEAKLFADTAKLVQRLDDLEQKLAQTRITEDADHKAQLDKIRADADARQNRLISIIFFGGSVLGALAGVVILVTAAQNPIFGPKVAFACFGFALVSGIMGVVILQLIEQIRANPWILWTGLGSLVLIATVAATLLYSNHDHHVSNGPGIQS